MNSHRYEPKFYEWQALCYVAKLLSLPVFPNVREFTPGKTPGQQREADGLVRANGRSVLIEIKSAGRNQREIQEILTKYNTFEHDESLIVAPSFEKGIPPSAGVRFVEFNPDVRMLREAYSRGAVLPKNLEEELAHGDHHFRYMSACRTKVQSKSFRNQVDKRIGTVPALFHDIRRRSGTCDVPVRVFWSVSRWLFPKDLFSSSSRNYLIRRGLVFDIDGRTTHTDPCQIDPGMTVCSRCVVGATSQTKSLVKLLNSDGRTDLSIVFSGRQGFHVYVLNERLEESEVRRLVDLARTAGIPIDVNLALDPKSVVTFPGSIHGLSMLRATVVKDLDSFSLNDLVSSEATSR